MPAFYEGDLVAVKSGGPKMTVSAASPSKIVCVWFDNDNKRCEAPFAPGTLEPWANVEARANQEADAMTAKIHAYSSSLWS
jgi:uncharacterized protein YodC (DUF2158 family)